MKLEHIKDIVSVAKEMAPHVPAAVVAANDSHILEAVILAKKDGVIDPFLIGPADEISALLAEADEDLEGYTIVDCATPDDCAVKAMELVNDGTCKMVIKGLLETAQLMRRALSSDGGIRRGVVSAVGLFEFAKYHKLLALTDMGINTFPDLERKQGIIANAVDFMRKLGVECPKVAVLSSTEHANEKQPDTLEAAELKRLNQEGVIEGCVVEGPISFDLAIFPDAWKIKKYESPVAGDADILVFPDILCGNVAVKAMGFFGEPDNADIVLGCAVPIVFGSRGGPVEGKYMSIGLSAIVAAQS